MNTTYLQHTIKRAIVPVVLLANCATVSPVAAQSKLISKASKTSVPIIRIPALSKREAEAPYAQESSDPQRAFPWETHPAGEKPDALGGFAMVNVVAGDKQHGLSVVQLVRGDENRKEIALTFDDGPHPPFTERLLDLLKQLDVKATFFVVGRKVDAAPEILARMVAEKHDVANHTYHHVNLKTLPYGLVENEIRLDNDAIRRACGVEPLFFRPPGGQRNGEVVEIAHRLGMSTILWTDDPADYAKPGANVIEQKVLQHVRPGATILLHDGIEQTFHMLPDLVAHLRQQGYKFVTISEMVQHLEASCK